MHNKKFSIALNILLLIIMILSLILFPTSAKAALVISGINPSTISNQQNNTLTISGNDFVLGSIVSIDGFASLDTSYFSNTTLLTVVPAGIPAGTYTITVTNPDSSTAFLSDSLEVISGNPTAAVTQTTEPPSSYERPVLVVNSYSINQEKISPGNNFTLYITLNNAGQHYARNVVATFTPGDLIPRETGGVVAVGEIAPNNRMDFAQPFFLSTTVWGYVASLNMLVTYADEAGILYNETFVISLPVYHPYSASSTSTPTPTITPTPALKPQLVITSYSTDISPLQPGNIFNLSMMIKNMGATTAMHVSMIVGGGSSASSSDGGTQLPGGVSGGSGEFTNFAPIGASNVQSLGEITPGLTTSAIQSLIVNTTTAPGAYPLKISFVYSDEQNQSFTDDQVITLLVYRIPNVDISFYQELPPIFTGQMNMLPLQVVNLGRTSIVLGNMRVDDDTGQSSNNSILVGTLESGGYFTMDAMYMPDHAGPLDLIVTIDYTNDFNQPQVITESLTIEAIEQPIIEPPIDGGINDDSVVPSPLPETFLQKIWRFILGLVGLDSGIDNSQPSGENVPIETSIPKDQPIIVPAQPLKGP
jgi:hypothetical protein